MRATTYRVGLVRAAVMRRRPLSTRRYGRCSGNEQAHAQKCKGKNSL
jgi:hypothetical protein